MTRLTLTPTWQLVIFPAVPVYWRATPTEALPHLSQPVSSIAHACASRTSTMRWANRSRTGATSHGLLVTK